MRVLVTAGVLGCGPDVVDADGSGTDGGTAGDNGSSSVGTNATSFDPSTSAGSTNADESTTADATTVGQVTSTVTLTSSSEGSTSSGEASSEEVTSGEESTGCVTVCEPHDCSVPSEYATIQSAIDDPLCARIWIAEGEYFENLTIARDVEVIGEPEADPLLRGAPEQRVVTISEGVVRWENVRVSGDSVVGEGGIENAGDLTIVGTFVMAFEKIGGEGAAIRSTGPLTLIDAVMEGNVIYSDDAIAAPQTIQAADIYIESAPLVIQDSNIYGGTADLGTTGSRVLGGQISAIDSEVVIEDSSMWAGVTSGNASAGEVYGGVLYIEQGSLHFARSDLHRQITDVTECRGGVLFALDTDVFVQRGSLSGEAWEVESAHGAALYVEATSSVAVAIERAWLGGYAAGGDAARGGAIFVSASAGGEIEMSIVNARLGGNTQAAGDVEGAGYILGLEASEGGTILATLANTGSRESLHDDDTSHAAISAYADPSSEVTIVLQNSILWGDGGPAPVDCHLDGATLISNGYNMFSSAVGCDGAAATDLVGVDPLSTDLEPDSPAIDAGDPSGCTDADGVLLDVDYEDNPRPVGPVCDIGPIEYQGG